ncbi:hypothetical protein JB92DRAFT_3081973 [Gautieria morchelliformis]|nr:hypothetical protein JB92DRAFT_3081973 [Gautieria morchelliformis]
MFLLDLLDNLPCLRLSEHHMEMFLWGMSECGAQEVPSLYALQQTQEWLRKECGGVPTSRWESSMGNILYLNDISKIIANDYMNPQVDTLLHFYPEEMDGPVSESWPTKRIKEMPPDQLTPMHRKGLKDFYVNKLAELESGEYVIPHMWIVHKKRMCADAHRVYVAADGLVVDQGLVTIDAEDLLLNYLDLVDEGRVIFAPGSQSYANAMPNPLRAIADGDELYFRFLWADDVGGNITKLINAHKNIYLAHANVPGCLLQQEYFVRFVATTPHGTMAEQFEAVLAMVQKTLSDPPHTYNAHSHQFCKFQLAVPRLPADNPQQSEEASHIGPSGNCKCQHCTVGGPAATRESDDGYHALHETEQQLWMAAEGKPAPVSAMQTATGVKDCVAQIWIGRVSSQAKKLKKENPSWTLTQVQGTVKAWLDAHPGNPWSTLLSFPGLDPHKDTPVEILHTILLGLIKYVWHNLHTSWTDSQHELFIAHLQGTNIDGLSVPPIWAEYMSQYRNSLISKHFKALMQTMLWYHVIPDMAEYLANLRVLIGNVLDAFDGVNPARITNNAKLHILVHLPEDVEWFGLPIRYATEVFECFNHIFCMCSVLSNHHAPGRDIARKCPSLEQMKHIMSGGFWPSNTNKWTQVSRHVRSVLHSHPIVQTHLGWVSPSKTFPGHIKLQPFKNAHAQPDPAPPSDSTWIPGLTVVAESEDTCHLGSWVCAQQNQHQGDTHFILNLFALHNAHLVCQVLPRHLTAPQPLHVDCRMYHDKVAAALRVSQALKRS